MPLTHDELAKDLAAHLRGDRRMTWCDLQLGPAGSPRPDVYAVYKSYTNPCPVAYECKVSTSDFRADVTTGKWQTYLRYASGVYFACEGDLIKKSEVPEHCGLIVLRNGAWRAAKRAILSPVTIPEEALLKLLIDGVEREGPRYRGRGYNESAYLDNLRRRFGDLVAGTVSDRLRVERETEQIKWAAERIEEDARVRAGQLREEALKELGPLRRELCDVLGVEPDTPAWRLKSAIKRLRDDMEVHPAARNLRRLSNQIHNSLATFGDVGEML